MTRAIFFMSLLALVLGGRLDAAPKPDATVAIRTYNYANLQSGQLGAAQAEAGEIFSHAGIAVEWTGCRVPGNASGAPCTGPLTEGRDLMRRLVDRTADLHTNKGSHPLPRALPLGESMLDRERRGGVLMTVDMYPVRAIAARAGTRLAILLGRAIAHEVGHMLLGTAEHGRLGLMRPFWSHEELRGTRPASWTFSAREAAQMRRSLMGKSRTAD